MNGYNENEFLGKNIIVTGASSGIGQSIAFYFLNCGANVVLAGQDTETMTKLCKKYNFSNATIMKVNLQKDVFVKDFKNSVIERLKYIDILVNCAGIKLDGDIEKTFPQDFDYTIDTNLRSVFYLIKSLAEFIKPNGSIINMSCLYGTRPICGMISYAMSKAGLETLTKYAAAEFASIGIRVNAITACPVETNSLRYVKVPESEIERFNKRMEKNIPLGRIARPDDIAKAIIFLASQRSSKITGQIIKVDGGRSLTSSGYVHYKGMKNMNARFEPDSETLGVMYEDFKAKIFGEETKFLPIKNKAKLKEFIEQKISESNFSTRLSDAHTNINPRYLVMESGNKELKQRFCDGESPNPLYAQLEESKLKIEGNMSSINNNINNNYINDNSNNINNNKYVYQSQLNPEMNNRYKMQANNN